MKKLITYGTYDLLHHGHLNLLRRAKELGDYLIVGVTSDSYDRDRGKLNVSNNVLERVEAVKATGYADEVIIEDNQGPQRHCQSPEKGKVAYAACHIPRNIPPEVPQVLLPSTGQRTYRLPEPHAWSPLDKVRKYKSKHTN